VNRNFSHESYHDNQAVEVGGDRSFGCTLGAILIVIGLGRSFTAGMVTTVAFLIFALGVALLSLAIAAPYRLTRLNRLWLKLGVAIGNLVNPIVLALLFFLVFTPMALMMRMLGKRPLRLAPDHTAASYWIARQLPEGGTSSMRTQF
jgi:hypothetical protein